VLAVEYVHASRRTRPHLPRLPSMHPPRLSLNTSYPIFKLPLHRCHQHPRCHLRHPPHSRVSMWHPTTAQRVSHPTRLPTCDSDPSTHNIYRSMNRYVLEPMYRPRCHLTSSFKCHNPLLPRVGLLHHQILPLRILALYQTFCFLSGRSLLRLKTNLNRHVLTSSFLTGIADVLPRLAHFTSQCLATRVTPCRMT
jgi:hypothetical protein